MRGLGTRIPENFAILSAEFSFYIAEFFRFYRAANERRSGAHSEQFARFRLKKKYGSAIFIFDDCGKIGASKFRGKDRERFAANRSRRVFLSDHCIRLESLLRNNVCRER